VNLETLLGHIGALVLIATPFVIVYALVVKEIGRRKAQAASLHAMDRELKELQEQIPAVSTAEVPGRTVEKTLGPVVAEGSASAGFLAVAEKRALISLLQRARALGADAVVSLHRKPDTDAEGKVRWRPGVVRLAGEAVKLSEPRRDEPSL
jgi:uncharacterized protein YbjQ (UPF0145 family)